MKMKEKKEPGVEFPYLCEDNESGTGDNQNANEEKENVNLSCSPLLLYSSCFIIKRNVKTFNFNICL